MKTLKKNERKEQIKKKKSTRAKIWEIQKKKYQATACLQKGAWVKSIVLLKEMFLDTLDVLKKIIFK